LREREFLFCKMIAIREKKIDVQIHTEREREGEREGKRGREREREREKEGVFRRRHYCTADLNGEQ
jgi:hypothetical protein